MAARPGAIARRAVLAISACVLVSVAVATSVATAHSGRPASIAATVDAMSVQVSGTWSWSAEAKDSVPSYVGFAISWGDVTSGNDVGPYHIGDGTAPTNVVMQPTVPAQGSSGAWGPVSHTYAAPGTYTVCSIIYDLGEVKTFPATGHGSLVAGGPDRNLDNSVDNAMEPGVKCATVTIDPVATPTPTPTPTVSQVVEGATAVAGATATPPPTATLDSTGTPGGGLPIALLLLALWAVVGTLAVHLHARVRTRL